MKSATIKLCSNSILHTRLSRMSEEPVSPSTSESATDATEPHKKKRKSTYYVRKESIAALRQQVKSLEKELAHANANATASPYLAGCRVSAAIDRHQRIFAGLESLLASYKQATHAATMTPLATFIRMPKAQAERDKILQSLHRPKLDAAARFMAERTRFLNLQLPHVREELFHPPDSDAVSIRLDVAVFDGGFSLRQVYNALQWCLANEAAILSKEAQAEHAVTVGEDPDGTDDFQYGQVRSTSMIPGGLQAESNTVTFLRLVEREGDGTSSHAIATCDFVDQDDRHEGPNETSVQNQRTSAILLTETSHATGKAVSLCKWEHSRYLPGRRLTREQVECLHNAVATHVEILVRVMNARLRALW